MNKACLSNRYKQKIIKQALNANFILLYQPAPNSFIIIQKSDHHIPGDHEITENEEPTTTSSLINRCSCNLHDKHNCRPHRREPPPPPQQQQQQLQGVVLRQRYRVVIGPQICNCQNEFMPESGLMTTTTTMMMTKEPCIHLLFVMLHILKIPSDDIHLMVIPLPSSKAEFWIENYRNYRQSIRQSYTKNKKYSSTSLSTSLSSNTAKSNANSPELSKFSEKLLLLNNTTSNNEAVSNTRLIIPQPIRHEQSQHHQQQQQQQANNNLSHLRAIIHPNTFDSTELSSITQDIIPVSRREVESSTGSGGSGLGSTCCDPSTTSYNTTVTSRTSSIDSIESYKLDSSNSRVNDFHHPLPPPHHHHQYHHRPHLPHHHHPHQHDHRQHQNYQMKTATSINSDRSLSCRRPRTAPQPELPPRLGRTRTKFVRHSASSTTFCPLRDCSPMILREGCLTPIESEENSTNNSLKHRTTTSTTTSTTTASTTNNNNNNNISSIMTYSDNYDKLQEPLTTNTMSISMQFKFNQSLSMSSPAGSSSSPSTASGTTTTMELISNSTSKSNFTHARRSSFKPITSVKQKPSTTLINNNNQTPLVISSNTTITTTNNNNNNVNINGNINNPKPYIPSTGQQTNTINNNNNNTSTVNETTTTNATTATMTTTRICTLCLRECHNKNNSNNVHNTGNQLVYDGDNSNTNNIVINDSILVCESILSDYEDDDNNNNNSLNGEKSICGAVFHTSCCKIWLEEIQSDGDLPQCPVCGCVWIELPNFDIHLTTVNGNVNTNINNNNTDDQVTEMNDFVGDPNDTKMISSASSSSSSSSSPSSSSSEQIEVGEQQHQQEQRLTKTHQRGADNNDDAVGDGDFDVDNVGGGVRDDDDDDDDGDGDNSNTDSFLPSHQSHRRQSTTNQRKQEHHDHDHHQQQQQKQSSNETPCSSILNQSMKNTQAIDSIDLNGNITMMNSVLSNPPFSEYNSCISAFSLEIANALVSYDWTIRQYALQQTTHLTIRQVLLARQCHLHSDHSNLVCSINSTTNNNNSDNQHGAGVGVDVNDPNCGCCCCCCCAIGGDAVDDSSQSSSSKNHRHHHDHQRHHGMYTGPDCVRIMFKLIQHMLDDPIDAIFTDALRAFRELLGYLVCYNKETQSALQKAIGPILRRLLRFVGGSSNLWSLRSPESLIIHVNNPPIPPMSLHQDDENKTIKLSHKEMKKFNHHITSQSINNKPPVETPGLMNNELDILQTKSHLSLHPPPLSTATVAAAAPITVPAPPPPAPANFRDRSNLALATLIELAKGQSGALALGREVHCASQCLPISGIQHMVRFVLSSAKFHATHLIGRLTIVDKLIRMHQTNIQQLSIEQQQPHTTTGSKSFQSNEAINTGCHNSTNNTVDIISGEKVSVQGGGGGGVGGCGETPSSPISSPPPPLLSSSSTTTTRTTAMNDQSLARRHLCSTIVFARRHLLPIYPKPDNMTMCFPYHYQLQATTGGVTHAANENNSNNNNNNNSFLFKSSLGSGSTAGGGTAAVAVATLTGTPTTTTAALSQPNGLSIINYFHHTQYKANRIARRVFLTACRALLTWRNEEPVSDHCDPIPPSTFNANTFIESEINRLDAPLATWFRNRLCLLLYPNDTTGNNMLRGVDQHSSMIKSLVSSTSSPSTSQCVVIPSSRSYNAALTSSPSANSITQNQNNNDSNNNDNSKSKHKYSSSQSQHQQQKQCTNITLHNSSTSSSPIASSIPLKLPPIPPPRRVTINNFELNDNNNNNNKKDLVKYDPVRQHNEQRDQNPVDNTCDNNNNIDDKNAKKIKSQILNSSFVRIALEPAYDLVALSESGNYSSASEFEDEDEDDAEDDDDDEEEEEVGDVDVDDEANLVDIDDVDGDAKPINKKRSRKKEKNNPSEPIYTGRSLGSEADLQCEQVTVLRNALTRSTNQLKPLLPIPGLSFVMNSFQSTKKLPTSDEYYESVDWIRGPILGHGAFSQCYQARDVRTGLLLAVKRIRLGRNSLFSLYSSDKKKAHQSQLQSIINNEVENQNNKNPSRPLSPTSLNQLTEVETEVRIMLQLDHPNVLRLFGAVHCVKRGFVDLFIEWMPGGSITSLLQQYGAFNESITCNYGIQLIRGLAYLHKHGILHRDLKGANLLIDSTGAVIKISDFGASARLSGEQSVAGQFQGQVIGTFSFMAPEVLRGETYGRACDIWSVGCCLIEMLTSKPPWHDARLTNRYALMYTIATSNSPPTYPEGLSTGLISVLDACFARNPTDRPTASQLLTFKIFADLISQQVVTSSIDEGKTQQSPLPQPPQPLAQPQPVQKQKEQASLQSLTSSSSLKTVTALNTSKNRDQKTLKTEMNTTKLNTKSLSSSFSYQRFLKTFQSNKNSPSLSRKKVIRLQEVLQESKEEYQRRQQQQPQEDMMMMMLITSPSDENIKCSRQLSDHHQHIQHQSQHLPQHQQHQSQQQQQQQSNQHVDDTILLTRRQKFRRPTLPGISFHRKYRSRTPVAISFN